MLPGCLPTSTVRTSRSAVTSTSDSVEPSKCDTQREPSSSAKPAADLPVSRTTAAGSSAAGDGVVV